VDSRYYCTVHDRKIWDVPTTRLPRVKSKNVAYPCIKPMDSASDWYYLELSGAYYLELSDAYCLELSGAYAGSGLTAKTLFAPQLQTVSKTSVIAGARVPDLPAPSTRLQFIRDRVPLELGIGPQK